MASLLIRSIRYLVTCDDKDQLLEDVDLYCEDGLIRQIEIGRASCRERV